MVKKPERQLQEDTLRGNKTTHLLSLFLTRIYWMRAVTGIANRGLGLLPQIIRRRHDRTSLFILPCYKILMAVGLLALSLILCAKTRKRIDYSLARLY